MSPVPPIVHLLAVVAGLAAGLSLGAWIAPDLPDADVKPGVVAPGEAGDVEAADPESLFGPGNLTLALNQLSEQLGADGELVRVRIEPGELVSTEGAGGFAVSDVSNVGPTQLEARIQAERPKVTLEDFEYVELVQTEDGPEWYVQLVSTDPKLPPPWTYGAPLDLSKVKVGRAPPKQIAPE